METKTFENWIACSEEWREYDFGNGKKFRIEGVSSIFIKKSGSHKITDREGLCHYIPSGWIGFTFKGHWDFNVE